MREDHEEVAVKKIRHESPTSKNSVPIIPKGRQREVSIFNVSTTQAIFLAVLLMFLLIIAMVVMLVGWASSRMIEMQERH